MRQWWEHLSSAADQHVGAGVRSYPILMMVVVILLKRFLGHQSDKVDDGDADTGFGGDSSGYLI
jgi:hypothetical protein